MQQVDGLLSSWVPLLAALLLGYVVGHWRGRNARPEARKADARDAVATERSVDELLRDMSPDLRTRAGALIADGHAIDAIKLIRAEFGTDLKTAKDLSDRLRPGAR